MFEIIFYGFEIVDRRREEVLRAELMDYTTLYRLPLN
jgi:hypothetical protein